MGLRRVDKPPERKGVQSQLDKDMLEFCESCMGCAELTGYGKGVGSLASAVRYRIDHYGYPCKLAVRGGSVYLVRDYGKSEAWKRNRDGK